MTPNSPVPHGREKRREGREGRRKNGLLALIIFILATLEIVSQGQKSVRDTPAKTPRLSGTVFKNPGIYVYIYVM